MKNITVSRMKDVLDLYVELSWMSGADWHQWVQYMHIDPDRSANFKRIYRSHNRALLRIRRIIDKWIGA